MKKKALKARYEDAIQGLEKYIEAQKETIEKYEHYILRLEEGIRQERSKLSWAGMSAATSDEVIHSFRHDFHIPFITDWSDSTILELSPQKKMDDLNRMRFQWQRKILEYSDDDTPGDYD